MAKLAATCEGRLSGEDALRVADDVAQADVAGEAVEAGGADGEALRASHGEDGRGVGVVGRQGDGEVLDG
jgi:hypothetical protein